MRTALSSAAAPGASLEALLAGLVQHGLSEVELRVGDAHGVGPGAGAGGLLDAKRLLERTGARVIGLLDPIGATSPALLRVAEALGTRWVLDASLPLRTRLARAGWADAVSLPVAVAVRGAGAAEDARQVRAAGHKVVWEAHPDDAPLDLRCDAVLDACDGALAGVRVRGGGPEGSLHEGRGIGGIISRLVLAGWDGALTLAPSDAKYHLLWERWLGRHGGWGCGSRAAGPTGRRPLPLAEEIA